MSDFGYRELERLIDEYEEDAKLIRADKAIMLNYPKLFTMSVASSFEHQLKILLSDFVQYPKNPIRTTYPNIHELARKRRAKPMEDKIFAKLEGYEKGGMQMLNANPFYDLFGGQVFIDSVKEYFEDERLSRIEREEQLISGIYTLLEQSKQYEEDYAKHIDIKERLQQCNFDKAQNAYLTLKLKRNRVAHDYMNGLTDSFEDIRNFYYDAIIYVIGLEKAIIELTNQPT